MLIGKKKRKRKEQMPETHNIEKLMAFKTKTRQQREREKESEEERESTKQ